VLQLVASIPLESLVTADRQMAFVVSEFFFAEGKRILPFPPKWLLFRRDTT